MNPWITKLLIGLIPVALAALVGIAWNNSHRLVVLTTDMENVEHELAHLRELVENKLIEQR